MKQESATHEQPISTFGRFRGRIEILDLLRGLAALAVCYHHLTGRGGMAGGKFFRPTDALGDLGVDVFFVVSGFIIPYSLSRGGYVIADFGRFLCKRILRLDPPYFAAMGCAVALGLLAASAPGYAGAPYHISFWQLVLHLGYLNAFFHYEWVNPVFWSLAVEFQYYLMMGALFPLLTTSSRVLRLLTLVALGVLGCLYPEKAFLLHWLPLFLVGIVTFQFEAGLITKTWFLSALALLFLVNAYSHSASTGLIVVFTGLAIAFSRISVPAPLKRLGQISYSLYLVHYPIGARVMNIGLRFFHSVWGEAFLVVTATAICLGAAHALFRLVEAPAQHWSSRIRYRTSQKTSPLSTRPAAQGTPSLEAV